MAFLSSRGDFVNYAATILYLHDVIVYSRIWENFYDTINILLS